MIYLDTSVLGALFFREPTASAILARLETVDAGDLCISAWTLADILLFQSLSSPLAENS